jgi:hypothetical protein
MNPITTIPHGLSSGTTQEKDVVPLAQRLPGSAAPYNLPASVAENPLLPVLLAQLHQIHLPNPASPENKKAYTTAIADCIRSFTSPESGEAAFITLEEQTAIIQKALEQTAEDTNLYESLKAVLLGTSNLQFEMNKWMQNILISDGTPEEFADW